MLASGNSDFLNCGLEYQKLEVHQAQSAIHSITLPQKGHFCCSILAEVDTTPVKAKGICDVDLTSQRRNIKKFIATF